MESKKINQLATELTPALDDLTIIGDPTTGISKKITLSQMASLFTGTVEEYANLASFPLVGVADTIYIALDTNVLYRWDTTLTSYVELSPNIINSLVFNDANGFDGTISLVGSVATLTITTALTQGSVGFIGASGALTQDNSNFYWDNTNKRLGINTNAPTTAIDAFGSGIIGRLNGTSTNNSFLGFASAGTNQWSIGNVQSDQRFRIYSEANTAELVSVLQTGEFGIGIANPTTKLHIDGGASALIANLDANVSVAKSISFRSDNSNRINLEVSGTESGSNAGANLFLRTYTDAGALIETPFSIVRSTGVTTIKSLTLTNALSIANGGTGSTTQNFVDLTTNQSIGGAKIFTGSANAVTLSNAANLWLRIQRGTSFTNIGVDSIGSFYNTNTNHTFYVTDGTVTALNISNTGAATFSSSVGVGGATNTLGFLEVWKSGSSIAQLSIGQNATYHTDFFVDTTGNFYVQPQGNTKMTILSGGNVGIGTTTPSELLEVSGSSSPRIRISNTTNSANVGLVLETRNSSGTIQRGGLYYTPGTTPYIGLSGDNTNIHLSVTSGGQVGIGTNSPSALLQLAVANAAVDGTKGVKITNPAGTTVMLECGVNSDSFVGTTSASDFSIRTGNSEKMKITNGGGVEISQNNAGQPLIYAKQTGSSGYTAIQFSGNNGTDVGSLSSFSGSIYIGRWNGGNGSNGEIRINSSGGVVIPGSLSKGSGSFRIDHPLESMSETHQLVHSFVEAPQADLYYRGKLILVNGKGQANIDEISTMTEGTFEVLCREVQCFTTNETGWDLVKGKVIGNIIYIESQNINSTDEISWLVIGERKDKHIMDTDWTDENGKVIVEPLKPIQEEIEQVNEIIEEEIENINE